MRNGYENDQKNTPLCRNRTAAWNRKLTVFTGGNLSYVHSYTAYGADSSIIETMSIKFNTTFGDPEEIPQPQITISGSGVSIGDIYYKTEYENWKPGKRYGWRSLWMLHRESIFLCPLTIQMPCDWGGFCIGESPG